jgi:hypothetical protein
MIFMHHAVNVHCILMHAPSFHCISIHASWSVTSVHTRANSITPLHTHSFSASTVQTHAYLAITLHINTESNPLLHGIVMQAMPKKLLIRVNSIPAIKLHIHAKLSLHCTADINTVMNCLWSSYSVPRPLFLDLFGGLLHLPPTDRGRKIPPNRLWTGVGGTWGCRASSRVQTLEGSWTDRKLQNSVPLFLSLCLLLWAHGQKLKDLLSL